MVEGYLLLLGVKMRPSWVWDSPTGTKLVQFVWWCPLQLSLSVSLHWADSQEDPRSILLEQISPRAVARQLCKSPGRSSSCCFDKGTCWVFSSA